MRVPKLASILLTLALGGCGGSSSTSGAPMTKVAPAASDAGDASCPVAVAGTSVTVEDTTDGAALVFITTGDVADVRRRVVAMASMHNEHHASMGALPDGQQSGDGHAGHSMGSGSGGHDMGGHAGHNMSSGEHAGHAGGMIGVHSQAVTSDVEGGARIVFVADGADVGKLQGELRMHVQHFAAGTCRMAKP